MFLRYFQSNKKYSVTNSTSNTVEFANEIETYINRLILILSISVIIFIGTFFYLGKSFIAFTLIGVELLFSIILILNKSQYTLVSKVLLTSSINILTLLYASCFREGAGVHLLFFSYIGIPLILFNRDKESIYYRCGVSLPIISFSTLYLLDFKILPYANLTAFGTSLIFYMSALTTFVIIGASLRVFISQKKNITTSYLK